MHHPRQTQHLRAQLAAVMKHHGVEGIMQVLPPGVLRTSPRTRPSAEFTYEDLVCIVVITFAIVTVMEMLSLR